MAEHKIFAGPRIRRIRNGLGLTQSAMAAEIGVSASYLNLIERNQRPLTVQLLLKLAATYDLDLDALKGEAAGDQTALKEVFADPLLAGELPGNEELYEIAEAAPNAATGILKLYKAYRESQNRLSDLSMLLAQEGVVTGVDAPHLPSDEVRQMFETRPYCFPWIEDAIQSFIPERTYGPELWVFLLDWLRKNHNITVQKLPVRVMPQHLRRFDKHTLRLFISDRLSPVEQLYELAAEVTLLAIPQALQEELNLLTLSSDEAHRLVRNELSRYAALAMLMPYGAFLRATKTLKSDVSALAARFGVSFERAAMRMTTLNRPNQAGLPFFLMEVDHAGNILRRSGVKGYPKARFGGYCPKLPVYQALIQPRQIQLDMVETTDGSEYFVLTRSVDGPQPALGEHIRRTALLLGCPAEHLSETIYGEYLNIDRDPIPTGTSCRLCERQGCLSRAEAPVTRPLGLDEMTTGLSVFDFN